MRVCVTFFYRNGKLCYPRFVSEYAFVFAKEDDRKGKRDEMSNWLTDDYNSL